MTLKHRYVLGLDPSGNFNEGKGTTGWCILDCKTEKILEIDSLSAKEYNCQQEYWNAHLLLIDSSLKSYPKLIISVEDFLLYASKLRSQINSKLETPQLLGVLKMHCYLNEIPIKFRKAAAVKTRWSDEVLRREGFLIKQKDFWYCHASNRCLVDHERDAIRHAVHYMNFEN